jgi:hypothetical protein
MDAEYVRVLQPSAEPDLPEEAIRSQSLGQFGSEDLKCDATIVAEVVGEIDDGHPTAPEFALDAVAIAQSFNEL